MSKLIRRKIWPEFFADVDSGKKPFEVRNDDRMEESFEEADVLQLEEWDPKTQQYTGKICRRVISYVLEIGGTSWGHNTVVLGFSNVPTDRTKAERLPEGNRPGFISFDAAKKAADDLFKKHAAANVPGFDPTGEGSAYQGESTPRKDAFEAFLMDQEKPQAHQGEGPAKSAGPLLFPKVVAWPTEEHPCLTDPPNLPGSGPALAAKIQEIQAGATKNHEAQVKHPSCPHCGSVTSHRNGDGWRQGICGALWHEERGRTLDVPNACGEIARLRKQLSKAEEDRGLALGHAERAERELNAFCTEFESRAALLRRGVRSRAQGKDGA